MFRHKFNRLLGKVAGIGLILSLAGTGFSLATDFELRSVPRMPGSEVFWEDKPIYANGVTAPATHLRINAPAERVAAFYESYFLKADWEVDKGIVGLNIKLFRKKNKFFYLLVMGDGKYVPCDIYLINSPGDLAICKDIQEYMLKDNITPDTPGRDLPGLPRYPTSRRRLNFFAPYETAFLIYEADAKPYEVVEHYRKVLRESGWIEDSALAQEASDSLASDFKEDLAIAFFYRDEDTLYVNVQAAPKPARSKKSLSNRCIIIVAKNLEKELPFPAEGEGK